MTKGLLLHDIVSGYGLQPIIKGVTLEVGPGEVLVLMGASGTGKTTLLLTILGILTPTGGKVLINGDDAIALPIERRNIGYLPQDYGLFPHLNVFDNVAYGLRVRGVPGAEQEARVAETLAFVELQGLEKRRVQELSGGQRQRVGLARALAIKPNLLLLDEPLSSIDEVTRCDVATQLKDLFHKLDIPIILVTHNREDALFFCQRLAILNDGRIEQVGTVNELLTSPRTSLVQRLLAPLCET